MDFNEIRSFQEIKSHLSDFTTKEMIEISEEGKLRYENLIPPGYKDIGKEGIAKYNDLFIWKEIIKETNIICEETKQKRINVFFISEDSKESSERDRLFLEQGFFELTGCILFKLSMEQFGSWFNEEYEKVIKDIREKVKQLMKIEDSQLLKKSLCTLVDLGLTLNTVNDFLSKKEKDGFFSHIAKETEVFSIVPLGFLAFSIRCKNCILNSKLSMQELALMDDKGIACTRNFGKMSLIELKMKLKLMFKLLYPDCNSCSWNLIRSYLPE